MPTAVAAPEGSHWAYEEVKTNKGTESLGKENPILVWDDLDKARTVYGDDGITSILDGTSLRVSFQNIVRRGTAAKKSVDEIAELQVKFRPGKRVVGESTPASRVARAAKAVVGEDAGMEDRILKLLDLAKSGKLTDDVLEAIGA